MREWIVTNGLGGYASLDFNNLNTRKFHGLLIASLQPPTKRWIFVSNVLDHLLIDQHRYDLSQIKSQFSFDFFPSFSYEINGCKIKKTYFMEYGKNTSIIKYEVKPNTSVKLLHKVIINSRHFYDINSQRYTVFNQEINKDEIFVKPNNIDKKLRIILKNSNFKKDNYWIEFFYDIDKKRNDSWIDNNFHIGNFEKEINIPLSYYLVFTTENEFNADPKNIFSNELQRKKNLITKSGLQSKFNKLILSTDNFLVKKGDGNSIVAGYHWFSDWGRDILISLPGITLITKRFDEAKKILLNLSKYCKNGLIPNTFVDRDSNPVYNTVDASLWFVDIAYQYLKYTNDIETIQKIWTTLESIIDYYQNGTDFNIFMDDDFLISHNEGLTWMDVKIDNYYPTPRANKAVEIQALWYNSLKIMDLLSKHLKKDNNYLDLLNNVKVSFNNKFNELYDVVDKEDTSIRPNMIFLVSLDFNMIDQNLQKNIVDKIQNELLTIFGLRTLSPKDPKYKATYLGEYNKDEAYHNGTVWPWLIGPFIKGFIKTRNYDVGAKKYAYTNFLKPMFDVFGDQWDGSIQEIFDGDPPHLPRGCITQAWSVAEVLRSWVEDIEGIAPKNDFLLHEVSI